MDAVIGGTQLTRLPVLESPRVEKVTTPFGETSGPISIGTCAGAELAFLPRHGDPHVLAPHKINYRANMWALKELGARHVVAIATTGGIRLEYGPGVLVVPDQIIDYTHGRDDTYFDGTNGEPVKHIDVTEPYSQTVRRRILDAAKGAGEEAQDGGCYGCFNGPRLETAAEIRRLARDGCDIVGQTGMPEAALARELGLEYAALCPIVNHAAGLGDSKKGISREQLTLTRVAALGRVARILTAFMTDKAPV
jgi:5'-deoxy-5'-methylthioadenosine phosphorylase